MEEKEILLYGFSNFGEIGKNPSETVVKELSKVGINGFKINTKILEVSYNDLKENLLSALNQKEYDVILGFGVWIGIPAIKLERIAVNQIGSQMPDINRKVVNGKKITEDGPEALVTNLNINLIKNSLIEKGIPCYISADIDTFVCNYSYYIALQKLKENPQKAKVGFIHIPVDHKFVCESNKMYPSLSINTIIEGSRIILEESSKQLK